MNDPGSVSMFFSQTSICDLRCLFNKTWIIRLRKSCEKERRRKRTTLLGISVIVPTRITFLAADSQPWERTLVNQTRPLTCPGTRDNTGSLAHRNQSCWLHQSRTSGVLMTLKCQVSPPCFPFLTYKPVLLRTCILLVRNHLMPTLVPLYDNL